MLLSQNIGSWIVEELGKLHDQIGVFNEMLQKIDDLSSLLDFYDERVYRLSESILTKGMPESSSQSLLWLS